MIQIHVQLSCYKFLKVNGTRSTRLRTPYQFGSKSALFFFFFGPLVQKRVEKKPGVSFAKLNHCPQEVLTPFLLVNAELFLKVHLRTPEEVRVHFATLQAQLA